MILETGNLTEEDSGGKDVAKEETTTTTPQLKSNLQSEGVKEHLKADIINAKEESLCNGEKCNDSKHIKTVEYSSTEKSTSISDEVVLVLQEKTGWVCNGTVCTDLGPIYNRKNHSDGNNVETMIYDLYKINIHIMNL